MARKFKRVLLASDPHCGHVTGLHHPDDQTVPPRHPEKRRLRNLQREAWKFYTDILDAMRPIDVAIWNGDMIDGRQMKNAGLELIHPDRHWQVLCAAKVIEEAKAKKNYLTRGTDYHTGHKEDWENILADMVGGEIRNKLWLDVNGVVINARHHLNSSSIPHGAATPLLKEVVWNDLNAAMRTEADADIVVRSHTHYRLIVQTHKTAISTPGLQVQGGRYGDKRVTGTVHFGLIFLDELDGVHNPVSYTHLTLPTN